MKAAEATASLDSIFDDLNSIMTGSGEPVRTKPVTFWIPEDYKHKYDHLQELTKRKFSKKIIELLKKSIDKTAV